MDPQLAETTIKTYLNEIRRRLDRRPGYRARPMPVRVRGFLRRAWKSHSTWSSSSMRQRRCSMLRV
jgi:hypothetical protein